MQIEQTALPEVLVFKPKRHGDARGFFSETYNRRLLAGHGIDLEFVQDNQSFSAMPGTVRGLHYQSPPFAQDKLVRVLRGAILDVIVDIRRSSPNFGRHVGVKLTADGGEQVLAPVGFAHGFCTLEPDTEVFYKVTAYYAPDCDHGVLWNDPALAIPWPVAAEAAVLSDKDRALPLLAQAVLPFD